MAVNKLAQLAKVLENENSQSFNIGIDVHKESYHLAFRRQDGKTQTFVSPADPRLVVQMIQKAQIKVAKIVYEAGPTGFGLVREFRASGLPAIVVAPSKTPRPVGRDAKTDRLDCIKLAEYSAHGMLKSIAVPTESEEALRALVRRRHDVAEEIRRTKQRIKSLLLVNDDKSLKAWTEDALEAILQSPREPSVKLVLQSLVRSLKYLKIERKILEKDIAAVMNDKEREKVTACLKSVPGVGDVTAATFCAEIFQPERFENAGQVASLVGLAPVVRQSGLKKPVGRLIPTGQKRLRTMLVEAAWTWQAKDPQVHKFYQKMVSRSGLPQKAIVAVARKLLVILWRLALEKRPYRLAAA